MLTVIVARSPLVLPAAPEKIGVWSVVLNPFDGAVSVTAGAVESL